jgi:acyl-CoA reductase-like NAD-dependent aldehyde dehydrogenase
MVLGLLVGNSVLIKSSDQSLLTTNMIASTFREVCGLDVIAPLHANLEVMETFLEDKDTGFINFTGLTKSGHELYR